MLQVGEGVGHSASDFEKVLFGGLVEGRHVEEQGWDGETLPVGEQVLEDPVTDVTTGVGRDADVVQGESLVQDGHIKARGAVLELDRGRVSLEADQALSLIHI